MRPLCFIFLVLVFLPGAPAGRLASWSDDRIPGQVRGPSGPLAGAHVRWKGEAASVVTDAAGNFRLPRGPAGVSRLVAWKKGYFIGGAAASANPLVIELHALPAQDCEAYAWVDPSPNRAGQHNCANCHTDIYQEWNRSAHAHSARNPRLLNLYDGTDRHGRRAGWSLLADNPDGAGVCNSCHAPTADTYSDLRQLEGVKRLGVHCDYCHKIESAGQGKIGLTHGRFGYQVRRPAEGQLFFGPLADVDRGDDAFAPVYSQSVYCASCHEGIVFGVHVYSTYSEWQESPAGKEGKQCQSCHMAPTGKMTNMAPGRGGIARDPNTLANHRFFAGSQEDMLRAALTVAPTVERKDGRVHVQVEVRADNVGHRVPTGFVDRHLLLVVEGLPEADAPAVKPVDGPTLPNVAGQGLAGRAGRLYANLCKDELGRSPVPFWRALNETEDTRLQPGKPDRSTYVFPAEVRKVRLRLLYRKFWDEVAREKDWPDTTITVHEQVVDVGR